jgi:hypothetical protein
MITLTKLKTLITLIILAAVIYTHIPAQPAWAQSCAYWVAPAPAGSDKNPGSLAQPWATLKHAAETVPDNHCTVWFLEGDYLGNNRINRRFTTQTYFISRTPYQAILKHNGVVVHISGGMKIVLEGFIFTHSGPEANPLVVVVDRSSQGWAEWVIFRNNIFHDSYNNDILKIHNGSRFITVENNVFYNQGPTEEHMDVNSVTDVMIQDNIFFNDFEGSGRKNTHDTKQFIVIKDSNENADGLEGSERIYVRRNIFLNWEGREGETFVQVGLDGKPYHEAKDVRIENNLLIGNSANKVGSAFGIRGARDVSLRNNTIVGDLPSSAFAIWISIADRNPLNENIHLYNNIWVDPLQSMGSDGSGSANKFSRGNPSATDNLILDNNMYWNGGKKIPHGDVISPQPNDVRRVVKDPRINTDHAEIVLPRWNGTSFLSGNATIREEFVRLVETFGKIPDSSPAIGKADPTFAPADDILGRQRGSKPDMGAYQYDADLATGAHVFLPFIFQSRQAQGSDCWLFRKSK